MTVNWEKTGTNEGVLTFEIPEATMQAEMDTVFKRVRKKYYCTWIQKRKSSASYLQQTIWRSFII